MKVSICDRMNMQDTGTNPTKVEYLVLADDFTGALDTGIQLRRMGLQTKVISYHDSHNIEEYFTYETSALIINTDTRHVPPKKAFEIIQNICWAAKENRVRLVYKKTDSVLRGNVGAEIEAVASTGYKKVYFVPAYPKLNRTTIEGSQYINGIPIDQSSFGKDLFNPVRTSFVPDIVSVNPVRSVEVISSRSSLQDYRAKNGVIVFDAETDERLSDIVQWIVQQPQDYALAGCAGFAEHLQPLLFFETKAIEKNLQTYTGVLVISGSLNALSFAQARHAQRIGYRLISTEEFPGFSSDPQHAVSENLTKRILAEYQACSQLIIQTAGTDIAENDQDNILETGKIISNNFGKLTRNLFQAGFDGVLVVSGGDTLGSIVKHLENCSVEPIDEIEPGVVLVNLEVEGRVRQIITKSGGMGSESVYGMISDFVFQKSEGEDAN